jgi:hypothetical protein
MTNPAEKPTDSAKRAQADANEMGMNEDDEREAQKRLDEQGAPGRDRLGTESGSS